MHGKVKWFACQPGYRPEQVKAMRTGNVASARLQKLYDVCLFDRPRLILSLNSTRGEASRVLLIEKDIMKSVLSNRGIAAWKPLALVSALATLSIPALSQVTEKTCTSYSLILTF